MAVAIAEPVFPPSQWIMPLMTIGVIFNDDFSTTSACVSIIQPSVSVIFNVYGCAEIFVTEIALAPTPEYTTSLKVSIHS